MELPLGAEGRKATHDFLSLYSSSTAHTQQDPSHPQEWLFQNMNTGSQNQTVGGYIKTHDFLQPLEKNVTTTKGDIKAGDRPPAASVEHLLPGGVGTYSISYFNRMVLQTEGSLVIAHPSSTTRNVKNSNSNSNSTSYPGSSFTLWDESDVKKGKTGKEKVAAERHILPEAGANVGGGKWMPFLEKPSQLSSNHRHNATNFSSFASSQPSSSEKNQSFMDMIMTSAKNNLEEEDEGDEEEFNIKKEPSSHSKGNLSVKAEARTTDQKPNTPRSKHSATEQRRRSKINDRFYKLREIIPNSDQKRDKASFLLEVIEYIQFLQEKVNRYESSYKAWNQEPSKMMHWQKSCHTSEGLIDRTQGVSSDSALASLFGKKLDESNAAVSRSLPISTQNLVDSDLSTGTTSGERVHPLELTSKAQMQTTIFALGKTSNAASPVSPKQASEMDKTTTLPPSQLRSCTTTNSTDNKMTEQELTIESGTINISSVYSQGLLNSLRQALQSSGVDLSQASISVQINLGNRANDSSTLVEDEVHAALPRSPAAGAGKDFGHALKKLRTR